MANLMILFLSAFKDSPLSWAGLSYERINAFHRWIGRFIIATFLAHGIMMGYIQVISRNGSFVTWIGGRDVQTGSIAFAFLLLLSILYLPLPTKLMIGPIE
jgi:Ferric reductase like transmembrane component